MPYAELLRATVFLTAGGATALAALSIIGITQGGDDLVIVVALVWWFLAAVIGMVLGSPERVREGVGRTLAEARTAPTSGPGVSLSSPGRIAFGRTWPILLAVGLAGALGVFLPEVAVIASGYSLLVSLAWRNREAAVLAVERRDGVRFLVESGSAFKPIRLLRSPGLTQI
ncbi:MAG: hypothetical protein ACKOL0_07510 [Solirubrobacterales bacterium]